MDGSFAMASKRRGTRVFAFWKEVRDFAVLAYFQCNFCRKESMVGKCLYRAFPMLEESDVHNL